MKTYCVFGSDGAEASGVRDQLAGALGIGFEEHDSDYWNGIYYRGVREGGDEVRVVQNAGGGIEDLPYPEFANMSVIVEVNDAHRDTLVALAAHVPNLTLLRQRDV